VRCLGVVLSGKTLDDVDRYGEPVSDATFLFCLNPHNERIQFYLPPCGKRCVWEVVIDTQDPACTDRKFTNPGEAYDMIDRSAVLFREVDQQGS
jgi:hypothetical protein